LVRVTSSRYSGRQAIAESHNHWTFIRSWSRRRACRGTRSALFAYLLLGRVVPAATASPSQAAKQHGCHNESSLASLHTSNLT
jgi:hypothetical protein